MESDGVMEVFKTSHQDWLTSEQTTRKTIMCNTVLTGLRKQVQ